MAKAKAKPKKINIKPKGPILKETIHLVEVNRQVGAGVDLCIHSLSSMLSKLTDLKMKIQDRAARELLISSVRDSNELLTSHIAGIESWIESLE
jgi:hypothetical protein